MDEGDGLASYGKSVLWVLICCGQIHAGDINKKSIKQPYGLELGQQAI